MTKFVRFTRVAAFGVALLAAPSISLAEQTEVDPAQVSQA